jgi:hypothetical protein
MLTRHRVYHLTFAVSALLLLATCAFMVSPAIPAPTDLSAAAQPATRSKPAGGDDYSSAAKENGGIDDDYRAGISAVEDLRQQLKTLEQQLNALEPRQLLGEGRGELARQLKEDAELDQRAHEIAKRYLETDVEQEKSEMETQLRELTERHFDLRQKRRESQVTRLLDELKRVREAIQKRRQARTQIIERRISTLLQREDSLEF